MCNKKCAVRGNQGYSPLPPQRRSRTARQYIHLAALCILSLLCSVGNYSGNATYTDRHLLRIRVDRGRVKLRDFGFTLEKKMEGWASRPSRRARTPASPRKMRGEPAIGCVRFMT